jgi:predicted peptidase
MGQQIFSFRGGPKNGKLKYLFFFPQDYEKSRRKKWPLILFLHGAAERGGRPEILKKHGIPRIVDEQPHFPFLAVSPQCPEGSTWARHVPTLRSLLDSVLEHYSADPDRLYLTGISMGGNGVWLLATRYPDLFAAVAPVCGYGLPSQEFPERVCVLKDIPVWVFHGSSDRIVHPSESRKLVDRLRECGSEVRFTIYPRCGHDSWTRTYEKPDLYEWFLSHRRTGRLPQKTSDSPVGIL